MSQEKVDRYKKEKANRKQNVKKEKMQNVVRKCMVFAAGLVLVCWIGYSAYDVYHSNKPAKEIEVDYSAFEDFSQKITEAGAASEAE